MHFSVNLAALANETRLDLCMLTEVLRRNKVALCEYSPVLLIEVKLRNNIHQLHIGFPVRGESPHIFPVAVKFVSKQALSFVSAVRNHMLAKIQLRNLSKSQQRFFQNRPRENINAHRCQIALGFFRFFFKINNPICFVRDHDAKTAGFFDWHRHNRHGQIRPVCLVKVEHHLVVHLIDVVSGENQDVIRMIRVDVLDVLVDCIGRAGIPVTAFCTLIGREQRHAADRAIQIPRNSDSDMRIETQGLVLGQYAHCVHAGIDAIAQREVNDTILPAEGNRRFCNRLGQDAQTASLTTRQQHGNHFFFNHALTSQSSVLLLYEPLLCKRQ